MAAWSSARLAITSPRQDSAAIVALHAQPDLAREKQLGSESNRLLVSDAEHETGYVERLFSALT